MYEKLNGLTALDLNAFKTLFRF